MLEPFSFHALKLRELVLWVHLGCTSEEREKAQEVRVTVDLRFQQSPKGTFTDSLKDTICYAEISKAIQQRCQSREYQLIERMGFDIYGVVREIAGPAVQIGISVHKVRPPVDHLLGGTHYLCGDFQL